MAKKASDEGVGVRESNLLPTKQALVHQFSVIYSVNKNRSKTSLRSFDYFTSRVKYMKLYCLISNAHYIPKVFCTRVETADTCLTLIYNLMATTGAPRFSFPHFSHTLAKETPCKPCPKHPSKPQQVHESAAFNSFLGLVILSFVCTKAG